jgi:hypothetical protein
MLRASVGLRVSATAERHRREDLRPDRCRGRVLMMKA